MLFNKFRLSEGAEKRPSDRFPNLRKSPLSLEDLWWKGVYASNSSASDIAGSKNFKIDHGDAALFIMVLAPIQRRDIQGCWPWTALQRVRSEDSLFTKCNGDTQ